MTSRLAVDIAVRLLGTPHIGHAGTLDPLASGVLVLCVGWMTRLVPFVQEQAKTYLAGFTFGLRSDTDDIRGQVEHVPGATIPALESVRNILPDFCGSIEQTPPTFSAVKINGQRAYALARRRRPVELPKRTVDVFRIDLVHYDAPQLTLRIECGSGTYVRSLGRDIGERLGCGAVMSSLVREQTGAFSLTDAIAPESLSHEHLLPARLATEHLPKLVCVPHDVSELSFGRPLSLPSAPVEAGECRMAVLDVAENLVAIGTWDGAAGLLRPKQVFAKHYTSE